MKAHLDRLLGPEDPAPVEVVNPDCEAGIVLVCEHAGRAMPQALGNLGLTADVLHSHRCWDVGADALARRVAARLKAPLVLQRYSRLVIDCNRPPESPRAIPTTSDQVEVPGNHISSSQRERRVAEIFRPMDAAIDALFAKAPRVAAFSIHSFTPCLDGIDRPWHAGFLSRRDMPTASALMDHIAGQRPDLTLALNEPYQIETDGDWFIPAHAERRGMLHSLIEIRNDQLVESRNVNLWAGLLADAITAAVSGVLP